MDPGPDVGTTDGLDTPNCPECLTRLEVGGDRLGSLYWWCPECKVARLS